VWRIIGQDRAVSLLRNSLNSGSLSHAYLFKGPAHVGKMTLALDLACALNCRNDAPPCGECTPCRKILAGGHADVQIIGLSGGDSEESKQRVEISIDQIRDIQHSASMPPFEGEYRVYIIEGAENLSLEAANSLLKTLEEPGARVVFILLTVNDSLVPETVISRCQRVELFPVPTQEIETTLIENWGVEPERALLLGRLSHGCPGWAIAAVSDETLVSQRAEWLDGLVDITDADIEERFAFASRLATQFNRNRGQVQDRLSLWLDWWRDLLLTKVGSLDNVTNADRLETLSENAGGYSLEQIRGFIGSIMEASDQLKRNANARLALEVLMLNVPEKKKSGGTKSAV